MDFSELVRSRRTVHNYVHENVDRSIVKEALRLSLWAPNHKLTFPWFYTWVGAKAREELSALQIELKQAKGEVSAAKIQALKESMHNPAHLISLGLRRSEPKRQHEDFATLACSVEIAALYLWQKGIATKWSTGGAWTHEKTYAILGIDPAVVQLEGALLIGIGQQIPAAPDRPPLENFLRESH